MYELDATIVNNEVYGHAQHADMPHLPAKIST